MLTTRFEQALVYAAQLHSRQFRKASGAPYVSHLLATAAIVLEYGGDEDEAIAALLHDAVEDQGGAATAAEIERQFGPAVRAIVDECSDTDAAPKPPWRARKEQHLACLAQASPSARLVTAADKLHNVRSILADHRLLGVEVWRRFTAGRDGTLWYYAAVADLVDRQPGGPLAAELRRAVDELQRLP